MIVSNKPSAGLHETNCVAVLGPLIAEIHLQANKVLCGRVMKYVQLVAYSCYCSPATATAIEVEAQLEGLDLGSNQRVIFRFLGSSSYHFYQDQCRCKCCKSRHLKVSQPGLRGAAAVYRLGPKHSLA